MLNWLKKHFIPHRGNDHKPHFLRGKNTRNILLTILFIEAFIFLLPTLTHINKSGGMAAVLPSILSDLTNEERTANKEATLTVNPILDKAAQMKATDMATNGYFAHTSPDGKTPWYWLEKAGYDYQYAGENLAVNFTDSKDVTNAWMNSLSHRSNIIKENYTEMGTGIATGIYEGEQTIFVAQVYANPLVKEVKAIDPTLINKPAKEVSSKTPTVIKEEAKVLGAETTKEITNNEVVKIKNPTLIQKMFASPHNTTNTILFIILSIVTVALLLNILIKVKHFHLDLITNGMLVIAILGSIFVINYYLSYKDVSITQSVDYSNQNK